ncbi:hypothetical protein JCM4814A_45410 [Streptomyces phaeofaciens JCM 4814]|uniref:Uncharacterized protein n=1 Tax=Streptomyces phaeofaciens TaxID=68254 RepID=A0A918LPA4_9ACTN|nr:hypothetical protein [Streptomyces phaeofaciens]GGT29853.1 hypothetical protein GCM10010226_02090 [Streptomyces phaeofaciens]
MGVYLVSVGAQDWSVAGEDGHGDVASALNAQLERRGLPPYEPPGGDREPPGWFEEKMSPSMDGFDALCRARLTPEERDGLLGWSLLVPFALEEGITLPVGSAYTDETLVVGAPYVLALAERLADALGLPLDLVPSTFGNLELTLWFLEGDAERAAVTRPGPWADDLAAAFYTAVHLRAAQYCLRHGRPMAYS